MIATLLTSLFCQGRLDRDVVAFAEIPYSLHD